MNPKRNLTGELHALESMTMPDLRRKYAEVFGEPPRSHNKPYLRKRIAWQLQALVEGGLSERARARATELAKNQELRQRMPGKKKQADAPAERSLVRPFRGSHDARIPMPGTLLTREFQGKTLRVTVLEQGFEFEGRTYRSLSAIARAAAGCAWNGYTFFGLGAKR